MEIILKPCFIFLLAIIYVTWDSYYICTKYIVKVTEILFFQYFLTFEYYFYM